MRTVLITVTAKFTTEMEEDNDGLYGGLRDYQWWKDYARGPVCKVLESGEYHVSVDAFPLFVIDMEVEHEA